MAYVIAIGLMGPITILLALSERQDSSASFWLVVGIIITILDVVVIWSSISANRRGKVERRKQYLEQEKHEQEIAGLRHADKITRLQREMRDKHFEIAQRLKKSTMNMAQSAGREKKGDWAIMGGLASGIGGPGAGLAAAVETINKNAEIEARNARNKAEWQNIANMASAYADNAAGTAPIVQTVDELNKIYAFYDSKPKDVLFKHLRLASTKVEVDKKSGALTVTTEVSSDCNTTIDGSLKADIMNGSKCIGTAILNLPVYGIGLKRTLSGTCANPLESSATIGYSVNIKPNDLWMVFQRDKGEKSIQEAINRM